jgi:hypothetical protein
MLPDDGPVGPKHVGVILKLILICVEGFKMKKILKQYIGANSWFYNLYIKDYCTVQKRKKKTLI